MRAVDHDDLIALVADKGIKCRGGKRITGTFQMNKTAEELEDTIAELERRADEFYKPSPSPARGRADASKLAEFFETGDARLPKAFFHCKHSTFTEIVEQLKEVSRYDSRGQDGSMSSVDAMLILTSRVLAYPSWSQMFGQFPIWSTSALQRGARRGIAPLAAHARAKLERLSDFGACPPFPVYPTAGHLLTGMELPLRAEDMQNEPAFNKYFLESVTRGRYQWSIIVAFNTQWLALPMAVTGGRNNPAYVMQTNPDVLKRLSTVELTVMEDGVPGAQQTRRDFLIDPDAGIQDVTETYPGAKYLRPRPGNKKKDKAFNDDVSKTLEDLRKAVEKVKLISQVLTPRFASADSLRHSEDVVAIAFWLANEIRISEGQIPPIPAGFRRVLPGNPPELSRDKTRILPAPLKVYPPNVFTGITPATLRLYSGRDVPRLQRGETEVQALMEEAYPVVA